MNVLTLSSQYGCNVRGWSVLCPGRWLDWVPHRVSSPRQDHKWTGTKKIWQLCFLPNVFMWLLFNVNIFSLLHHLNYRWQESFGEVWTPSPMAAWGIFLMSCADPRPPGQPSSSLYTIILHRHRLFFLFWLMKSEISARLASTTSICTSAFQVSWPFTEPSDDGCTATIS